MPELPEVETLRRSLEAGLIGRTVRRVSIRRRDVVAAPGDPPGGFARNRRAPRPAPLTDAMLLLDGEIRELRRHGKQLAIIDDRGRAVIVQLGMTGTLRHSSERNDPAHTHLVWRLDDGARLRFVDPRRFGLIRPAQDGPAEAWSALGPDALTIRGPALARRLRTGGRAIKAALLDQSVLAGVGNIYADEALYDAGLHPARPSASLDAGDAHRLARAIRSVLRSAIRCGGSTIRDYRDGAGEPGRFQRRHKVYGRGGLPCPRCGGVLDRLLIAQRTTVACPRCQVMGPEPDRRPE
jgi:formamidopyrimidine-DNA glycosylase